MKTPKPKYPQKKEAVKEKSSSKKKSGVYTIDELKKIAESGKFSRYEKGGFVDSVSMKLDKIHKENPNMIEKLDHPQTNSYEFEEMAENLKSKGWSNYMTHPDQIIGLIEIEDYQGRDAIGHVRFDFTAPQESELYKIGEFTLDSGFTMLKPGEMIVSHGYYAGKDQGKGARVERKKNGDVNFYSKDGKEFQIKNKTFESFVDELYGGSLWFQPERYEYMRNEWTS